MAVSQQPIRVQALPKYSRLGASSRLRIFQYLPYLAEAGFQLAAAPFFTDEYLHVLNQDRSPSWKLIGDAYRKRWKVVRTFSADSLIWLEYEFFPWLPAWLEPLSPRQTARLVVEYDDAVFHRYDRHRAFWVRWLLGRKIDRIMSRSRLVIAGNQYLADRALQAGASRVEVIPTAVDLDRYRLRNREPEAEFRIGWIGSSSTAQYLELVKEPLQALLSKGRCRFMLIGGRPLNWDLPGLEFLQWSEEKETSYLATLDVGIMPLPDDLWARGKCGYKLIQYMAAGLPVVASPVGVNQILVDGNNGFLARSAKEWIHALEALRDHPELRHSMGEAGRRKVELEYCTRVTAPRLVRLFQEIAVGKI
jgi:glycosyltransferase involved in cell wall biosynthesis